MANGLKSTNLPRIRTARKNAVILEPETRLKEKASGPEGTFTFDAAAIQKAEKALQELSENFEEWIGQEVEKLETARKKFVQNPKSFENSEFLFQVAHDLKGHATTFGYPIVHQFCTSLCRLLENFPDKAKIPEILINQHVDAVRAIVREKVTADNDEKALKLLVRLRAVTNEVIANEVKRNS